MQRPHQVVVLVLDGALPLDVNGRVMTGLQAGLGLRATLPYWLSFGSVGG
jgi:hypothetical protein